MLSSTSSRRFKRRVAQVVRMDKVSQCRRPRQEMSQAGAELDRIITRLTLKLGKISSEMEIEEEKARARASRTQRCSRNGAAAVSDEILRRLDSLERSIEEQGQKLTNIEQLMREVHRSICCPSDDEEVADSWDC